MLWCVYFQKYHFIVLFSETDDQAKTLLFSIREEMAKNERLQAVFGDILADSTEKKLTTTTEVCIRSAGRGSSTRGWRFKQWRPQLIITDDLEDDESVRTEHQRQKVERWFNASVIPMRDPAHSRLLIVGTTLHQDALILRKKKTGAYRVFYRQSILSDPKRPDLWEQWDAAWMKEGEEAADAFYEKHRSAMDEGTATLWPSRFPYVALMKVKKAIGSFAFQTEYQNDPIPEGSTVIKRSWVESEDRKRPKFIRGSNLILDGDETIKLEDLVRFGAADVAISQKDGADFFVLATGGWAEDGTIYIWDIVREHILAPEQIRLLLQAHQTWDYTRVGIEVVAYQEALKQMVDDASARGASYVPTVGIRPDKDKVRRLIRWQPQFEQWRVRICDSVSTAAVDELTQFPLAKHDDVPDAVAYLLEVIEDTMQVQEMETFQFDG